MTSEISPKIKMVHRQLSSVEDGRNDFNLFVSCFTEDGIYQFGNFDYHVGQQAIMQGFSDILPLIKGDFSKVKVGHDIWILEEVGDKVLCQMDTTYNIDGEERLRLPCFAVYTFSETFDKQGRPLIKKLQTFLDSSPLFLDTSELIPHGSAFKGLA
jgi:hypothetical protein